MSTSNVAKRQVLRVRIIIFVIFISRKFNSPLKSMVLVFSNRKSFANIHQVIGTTRLKKPENDNAKNL